MFQTQLKRSVKPLLLGATAVTVAATTSKYFPTPKPPSAHFSRPFLSQIHPLASSAQGDNTNTPSVTQPIVSPPSYAPLRTEIDTPEPEYIVRQRQLAEERKNAGKTKTPAEKSESRRFIDDGMQQVEVPVRVFPNWVPITIEQAEKAGPLGYLRYSAEHIADFVRNRVDDISYLFTGEIQAQLTDMTRYESSYREKNPLLIFNPYYEAIYRGLHDSHSISMKTGGSVPRFDYSEWLLLHPRPQVYLDMLVPPLDGSEPKPERITIQLYYDYLPLSTQNFVGLCDGFIDADRFLSYTHGLVHRIDHGHAFFAGDVLKRDGTAGIPFITNQLNKYLRDERFNIPHDGPGCVVMDNSGPDTNTSHFFITQRAMPELEGKYMVIGHVIDGMDVVRRVDGIPTENDGKPKIPVKILKSGILVRDEKDDAFATFKAKIPEFKDRKVEITPNAVDNNPNFLYP
jgi:cyclophilin family peptidyl-prolyl cis-trans isomerase